MSWSEWSSKGRISAGVSVYAFAHIAKAGRAREFHRGNHETLVYGGKNKTRLNETKSVQGGCLTLKVTVNIF